MVNDFMHGVKFLATVGAVYLIVGVFAYSFFMTSSPLLTGNAVIDSQKNVNGTNSQQISEKEGLQKTIYIIGVIFVTVLFIWIVAYLFGRRVLREKRMEIPKYRAFKTR